MWILLVNCHILSESKNKTIAAAWDIIVNWAETGKTKICGGSGITKKCAHCNICGAVTIISVEKTPMYSTSYHTNPVFEWPVQPLALSVQGGSLKAEKKRKSWK